MKRIRKHELDALVKVLSDRLICGHGVKNACVIAAGVKRNLKEVKETMKAKDKK